LSTLNLPNPIKPLHDRVFNHSINYEKNQSPQPSPNNPFSIPSPNSSKIKSTRASLDSKNRYISYLMKDAFRLPPANKYEENRITIGSGRSNLDLSGSDTPSNLENSFESKR
jgi:hypothetical protein